MNFQCLQVSIDFLFLFASFHFGAFITLSDHPPAMKATAAKLTSMVSANYLVSAAEAYAEAVGEFGGAYARGDVGGGAHAD